MTASDEQAQAIQEATARLQQSMLRAIQAELRRSTRRASRSPSRILPEGPK
jgi:hypothetical protein